MGLAGWLGNQWGNLIGRKPARTRRKNNKLKLAIVAANAENSRLMDCLAAAIHERDEWKQESERQQATIEGLHDDNADLEKTIRRLEEEKELLNADVEAASRMIDTQQSWLERMQAVETAKRAVAEGTRGASNGIGSYRVD